MRLEDAVSEAEGITGWMLHEELMWLGEQARERKVIVEVGSFHGRSTKVLAAMTPGVVYSVDSLAFDEAEYADCDQDANFKRNLKTEINHHKVELIRKPSVEAAKAFRRKADMVFIDGAHEHDDVVADLEAWIPRLKKGGLLCGHDITIPGVATAVEEVLGGWTQVAGSIWHDESGRAIGGIWVRDEGT